MDARKSRNTRVKTGCLVFHRFVGVEERVEMTYPMHILYRIERRLVVVDELCVYPETRRFCPIEPSGPSSRHQSSDTPAEVSPIPTEASQAANIPSSFAPSNGNGTQTQTVEGSLPEIKAYLEYKGYDTNPEQATALACMSALLRKTKMAEYFLGVDEPWVLLGDMFDTEFDLQCVNSPVFSRSKAAPGRANASLGNLPF
ncbi:hypothetical protein QFC21_007160 [Naganishia friedmannii]|uniref:Uncharacterized protein n=1 Tax=Naganishia friedmannii TaxID=89922 RepID=A0ACC2UY82_9TREE|nr:hypothetical protein QFC21_007160 [Naganishia friedmannii]